MSFVKSWPGLGAALGCGLVALGGVAWLSAGETPMRPRGESGLPAAGIVLLGMAVSRPRGSRQTDPDPAFEEARFNALFDNTPVQILEEDFTAVEQVCARLRAQGVTNLVTHLGQHPSLAGELRTQVRLRDANRPAIVAAGFAGKAEMIAQFPQLGAAPYPEVFDYQLEALWMKRPLVEEEFRYIDAKGQERACLMLQRMNERAGQPDPSRIVLVLLDLTTARRTVEAQMENQEVLRQILARANILLWWARVHREGGNFRWKINVPTQAFDSPLFQLATARDRGGLWDVEHAPDLPESSQRAEAALRNGLPGYQQEFRVLGPDGTHWLSEDVAIHRLEQDEWNLVGVISDITARHEAEEARRSTQAQLQQILSRTDCMLWQAHVTETAGRLEWRLEAPPSGLQQRIFDSDSGVIREGVTGDNTRSLYSGLTMPDQTQMDARSTAALRGGAPGYEQEFRLIKGQQTFWLHERVSITPVSPGHWDLVGITIDVTERHEAEEAREASEAQLHEILERADCLLWRARVKWEGGEMRWPEFDMPASGLFGRLFGAQEVAKAGRLKLWSLLDVPELPEMNQRSREALLSGAPDYEQDFRVIKPEGTIWLHEHVTITPAGPNEWNLVGVLTDVTARREAELGQKATEEQLQQLLTRADCLLWQGRVTENAGGVLDWALYIPRSSLYRELFGTDPSEHPNLMWSELNVPELDVMNARSTDAIRGGLPGYEQEFRVQREERWHWLHEQVSITRVGPVEWSLVGVITDISARREAELALAAEKERLAVTLRAMTEGVITTDTQGVVRYINRAATELIGWGEAAAVGRAINEVCVLHEARGRDTTTVPFAQVAQDDSLVDLPLRTKLTSRDGSTRQVEGCCIPIHAADSTLIGTVLVFRDVTERERLEQELARASKLESVGILAGGIAHDFNNILTVIMGNLTLALLDAGEVAKVEHYLRETERAALRARDLTQQLLTFAKGGDPVRAAVKLPEIITEVAQFALHGSRVKCEFDFTPDLWLADADKGQLGQVVQNLVINSVQAMPEGGVVRISARNESPNRVSQAPFALGDYVHIAVADTGTGIKAEHLEKIFDPYFTTKQQGSGLGLATVYSIVKKHRGDIEVESELGRGTTFHIWLPARREQQLDLPEGRPGHAVPMRGRVLLMDDEQTIRDMAGFLLNRLGFEVELAGDGAETVEKFQAAHGGDRPFDLVVMDLTVPGGMGGQEALERLRQIDPNVKAIVSSGYSSDPVLANYRRYGFHGMVAKPYQLDDLIRVLREVLGSHRPPE